MSDPSSGVRRHTWLIPLVLGAIFLGTPIFAEAPVPASPMPYDADTKALVLARKYLEGGEGSRPALLEALQLMGWGVRNAKGAILQSPPAGTDTGLAMRDYELDELLWKPAGQPSIRFISFAQAIAIPFENADPEELAQDLVDSIRQGAESSQAQRRFWARFIIALGRVGSANYDLTTPAPPSVILPTKKQLANFQQLAVQDPFAVIKVAQGTPIWALDDPVLAPSPRPRRTDDEARSGAIERDDQRLTELQEEFGKLNQDLASPDEARQKAAQEKLAKVGAEMAAISQRKVAASMNQMAAATRQHDNYESGKDTASDDEDVDTPRFVAEWRDQPLSLLQIALITRVLSADLRLAAAKGGIPTSQLLRPRVRTLPTLPLAMITLAQAPGPSTSFGAQLSGAAGDIWATASTAYTSAVLEHNLPGNRFSQGVGIANTIIAWFKTIMSVARQKITIEVENAPLVRTKTVAAGEQRKVKCNVQIDFPKSDVFKAIRIAGNVTSLDLQLPDGGPVSGAKVVWRLTEGAAASKYQGARGAAVYRPDLAVVRFAQAGEAAYISYTNDAGDAEITIEGTPQRKRLSQTVRPYPRRASIAVEVTIKVGNLTQDFNDAINTAMGGVISGGLSFIADMVLRTSFLFQNERPFEVTDWKEPAWQGEFEITVKGNGSKHQKGEKGGPDQDFSWSMDRYIEGRMHTPDWEEDAEQERGYDNRARHILEVDGDSRYFRLSDSSSSKSSESNNQYEAVGPMQIQAAGPNRLEKYSRSEPSGSATLTLSGGFMTLNLQPFFGAECIVGRSEQGNGRSFNKAGPEYLSLLGGITPEDLTIIEPYDGVSDQIEGTKDISGKGYLPYVPEFDVQVRVKYRLSKNGPPPKNSPP